MQYIEGQTLAEVVRDLQQLEELGTRAGDAETAGRIADTKSGVAPSQTVRHLQAAISSERSAGWAG